MTTINFETLEITDGTYTMQMDISKINDVRFTSAFYKMDPFGAGEISRKVETEMVRPLMERAAAEIFPMFVEYQQTKETKLFNELSNIRWSI